MRFASDQSGNARLKASLITSGVMIIAVLLYQYSLMRGPATVSSDGKTVEYASAQLFPQQMPVLQQGAYELVVTDLAGGRASLGRFVTTTDGQIVNVNGTRVANAVFALPKRVAGLSKAELLLVDDHGNRQPYSIDFLSGTFSGDRAVMGFGQDLANGISGRYMLGTPTDGNDTLNERSGLWFGDYRNGSAALQLPVLKRGWVYEGWAIVDGRPLTTGRFAAGNQRDAFQGFSDARAAAPGIPGEDFLRDPPVLVFPGLSFPVDLAGDLAAISIEPDFGGIDPTGQGPFGVNVLSADIPNRADHGRFYDLESAAAQPKATVVLR